MCIFANSQYGFNGLVSKVVELVNLICRFENVILLFRFPLFSPAPLLLHTHIHILSLVQIRLRGGSIVFVKLGGGDIGQGGWDGSGGRRRGCRGLERTGRWKEGCA